MQPFRPTERSVATQARTKGQKTRGGVVAVRATTDCWRSTGSGGLAGRDGPPGRTTHRLKTRSDGNGFGELVRVTLPPSRCAEMFDQWPPTCAAPSQTEQDIRCPNPSAGPAGSATGIHKRSQELVGTGAGGGGRCGGESALFTLGKQPWHSPWKSPLGYT